MSTVKVKVVSDGECSDIMDEQQPRSRCKKNCKNCKHKAMMRPQGGGGAECSCHDYDSLAFISLQFERTLKEIKVRVRA